MLLWLARRVAVMLPTLLFISIVTFGLMRFVPGDPIDVMYGAERPDPAIRAMVAQKLGLDGPGSRLPDRAGAGAADRDHGPRHQPPGRPWLLPPRPTCRAPRT